MCILDPHFDEQLWVPEQGEGQCRWLPWRSRRPASSLRSRTSGPATSDLSTLLVRLTKLRWVCGLFMAFCSVNNFWGSSLLILTPNVWVHFMCFSLKHDKKPPRNEKHKSYPYLNFWKLYIFLNSFNSFVPLSLLDAKYSRSMSVNILLTLGANTY